MTRVHWGAVGLLILAIGCTSPEEARDAAAQAAIESIAAGDYTTALDTIEGLRDEGYETPKDVLRVATLLTRAGDAAQAAWVLEDSTDRFPDSAEIAIGLGQVSLMLNDPSRARRAAASVPEGSEHHLEALVLQAQAELVLGDEDASLRLLQKAENLYPESAEARVPKIAALIRNKKWDEATAAIAEARGLVTEDEGRAALRTLEIALHRHRGAAGDSDASIAALQAMVDEEPGDIAAWSALVEQLMAFNRAQEAIPPLNRAIEADPQNTALLQMLADVHGRRGDLDAAQALLERAAEGSSPAAHLALIRFYGLRGDHELAMEQLGRTIEAFPDVNQLHLFKAEYLVDLGRLDEVEPALEDTGLPADDPAREYVLARLEYARGDLDSARELLERVIPALDNASAHLWMGHVLEAQGDLQGAERRFGLALARDPQDPVPAMAAVALAERRGDWRALASSGQLLIRRAPTRMDGYSALVTALVNLGLGAEAVDAARQISEAAPEREETHLMMAAALRTDGQFEEAVRVVDAANERFGSNPERTAEKVLALAMAGQLDASIEACRAGLAEHPDSARLHGVLGSILFAKGPSAASEASAEMDRALELDPGNPEPLKQRATYWASVRELDKARTDCEAYLELRPADAQVLFVLGAVHEMAGRRGEAIDTYRAAAEADENAFAPRNNLAMLLDREGEVDAALVQAQQAYRLAGDNPAVADTLARLYLKKGLAARAIIMLEKARESAPDEPSLQLNLASAYGAVGRQEEAREMLLALRQKSEGDPVLRKQVDERLAILQ